jgi:hypothetical protein
MTPATRAPLDAEYTSSVGRMGCTVFRKLIADQLVFGGQHAVAANLTERNVDYAVPFAHQVLTLTPLRRGSQATRDWGFLHAARVLPACIQNCPAHGQDGHGSEMVLAIDPIYWPRAHGDRRAPFRPDAAVAVCQTDAPMRRVPSPTRDWVCFAFHTSETLAERT